MLYKYKGISKSGKKSSGNIEANSIEDAKIKLRALEIIYQSLSENDSSSSFVDFSKREATGDMLSSFSKELSSYLNSGMTIVTAIKLLEGQHKEDKRYAHFLSSLKTMIEEGKSLYTALNSQTAYKFPDFFLQSLNVAGQSGQLSIVLKHMSNFFSAQVKMKRQISNAMVYPLFLLIVAFGMTGFLIAFVVPKITAIFVDMNQELPQITQIVLAFSGFLTTNYIAILIAFIVLIVGSKLAYSKVETVKKSYDNFILRLPIIGNIVQNYELGRFSYTLSLMLNSGVSYAHGVKLASTTFSNFAFKESFEKASQKVVEGNKLSNALSLQDGFMPKRNFMQGLALGEESSQVATILENISKLYQEENEDKLKLLLSLVEPFMMLFIGLIVGGIVIAMLLPIFSMNLSGNI
ncbi:MAG: type II secretion system F family protein [Sulfurovum sp.]|nr:MAG: type II secretion system F family protein [Sulfurovum sp.]